MANAVFPQNSNHLFWWCNDDDDDGRYDENLPSQPRAKGLWSLIIVVIANKSFNHAAYWIIFGLWMRLSSLHEPSIHPSIYLYDNNSQPIMCALIIFGPTLNVSRLWCCFCLWRKDVCVWLRFSYESILEFLKSLLACQYDKRDEIKQNDDTMMEMIQFLANLIGTAKVRNLIHWIKCISRLQSSQLLCIWKL